MPEEDLLVILDVNSGLVCEQGTVILRQQSVNKIVVNPYARADREAYDTEPDVDFLTVGQRGSFKLWKYDCGNHQILNITPEMN